MLALVWALAAACAGGALAGPSPPLFPAEFWGAFNGTQIAPPQTGPYAGLYWTSLDEQHDRQDSWSVQDGFNTTTTFLDLYPTANSYQYVVNASGASCTTYYLVGPMRQWGVPSSASYEGTATMNGYACDVWHYYFSPTWDETYYVTFNSAGGFWWPVRLVSAGQFVADWSEFVPGEPGPSSLFKLPPEWDCPPFAEASAAASAPAAPRRVPPGAPPGWRPPQ
jgi:hypothetical protein